MLVDPSPVDARRWPFVCLLQMTFPSTPSGRIAVGSGCLIGRRTILTAGHNVYDAARGGKAASIRVVFGAGDRLPVSAVAVDATQQWIDRAHWRDPLSRFDFGVVVLPDGDHPTPALPVESGDAASLEGASLNVAGYPVAPPAPSDFGTLFGARAPAQIDSSAPGRLFYNVNTFDGMSGGPAYTYDAATDTRTIRGIHTSFTQRGGALQIDDGVMELIDEWLNLFEP